MQLKVKTIEGNLIAKDLRFAIIVGRFNEFITSKLLSGALDALLRHGGEEENIEQIWVPGAYEIPLVTQSLAQRKEYDALICLGAIIKGATAHFDYVASEVAKGIAQISLANSIPVSFGILTTFSLEQAIERAGSKNGNKGYEAAVTAIEMANLLKQLQTK